VEEGRKAEENIRKQYLEKEEQHQVEVNILKGKLEEKDKLLRFQDSTKILDDILSSQRSPAIKIGLGFYETVEGESSSQGEERNSSAKAEIINEEVSGQPQQQPMKEILQRRSFPPNYRINSRLFPQMNNVECYVCHNFGHIAARCKTKMGQDHHAPSTSRDIVFLAICLVAKPLTAIGGI